jgi:hypothetical protein
MKRVLDDENCLGLAFRFDHLPVTVGARAEIYDAYQPFKPSGIDLGEFAHSDEWDLMVSPAVLAAKVKGLL